MLRVNQSVEVKNKLSNTLRNWLPILHSPLSDLNEAMNPFIESNPLIEVASGYEEQFEKKLPKKVLYSTSVGNASTDKIEALTITHKSLYDVLFEQIQAPLFPTPLSVEIANFVISNLDENGYYEGDSKAFELENNISHEDFEKVRKRFSGVEPIGICARDLKEAFEFQLDDAFISDDAYSLALRMIEHLQEIHTFSKEKHFAEAMHVISGFKNPPAIDYLEDSVDIVPDLMIYFNENDGLEVRLNDSYYPSITINSEYGVEHEFITQKLKEAKSLVDALEMRKATLFKVGLMILEYQYDFFTGGAIMPLTLKTLADEFGHNPSTISRAIANKYIECDRGMMPMKDFFTTAIDEDVSNAAIKEYLLTLVKDEAHEKPLSDMKLLEVITQKFKVKMVRRTIAKYRKQLNIAGSSERKKLYKLEV